MENTLTVVEPKQYGIEEIKAKELTLGLDIPKKEREILIKEFNRVSKMDISEATIPQFRSLRLAIQKNRTQGINKWHTKAKAYFLAGGKFVDAIKNNENHINEQMEEVLMNGEKHFENLEKERITKLQEQRVKLISEYLEDANERNLSSMEDDVWESFYQTKKQSYINKIEADKKAETERIEAEKVESEKLVLSQKRQSELRPYYSFLKEDLDLKELPEKDYKSKLKELKKLKSEHDAEQQRILDENNRLKKESEEKEELTRKRSVELQPFIVFIRDYSGLISKNEVEYQKEFSDIKKGAEDHWEFESKEKVRKEKEEKQKQIEIHKLAKIQAKKEADAEAEKKRLQDELYAKNKAEKIAEDSRVRKQIEEERQKQELAKAPIKYQLNNWIDNFIMISPEGVNTNETVIDILKKFESFKRWAKTEVDNS